jgi:hypothetical protein
VHVTFAAHEDIVLMQLFEELLKGELQAGPADARGGASPME